MLIAAFKSIPEEFLFCILAPKVTEEIATGSQETEMGEVNSSQKGRNKVFLCPCHSLTKIECCSEGSGP